MKYLIERTTDKDYVHSLPVLLLLHLNVALLAWLCHLEEEAKFLIKMVRNGWLVGLDAESQAF